MRGVAGLLVEGDQHVDAFADEGARGVERGLVVGDVLEVVADVAPVDVAECAHALDQRLVRGRLVVVAHVQQADAIHLRRLLRQGRPGARKGGEPKRGQDFASPIHSITRSARTMIASGNVMPSAFAVLRLTTSSKRVGSCTGRSAGLVPLRMRPAYCPARRNTSP